MEHPTSSRVRVWSLDVCELEGVVTAVRRRGFLAGLLALPFVAPLARAAAAIKRKLFPVVYVGGGMTGEGTAATLAEALKAVEPGGMIYLLPSHRETINEPITATASLIGLSLVERPVFTWQGSGYLRSDLEKHVGPPAIATVGGVKKS